MAAIFRNFKNLFNGDLLVLEGAPAAVRIAGAEALAARLVHATILYTHLRHLKPNE